MNIIVFVVIVCSVHYSCSQVGLPEPSESCDLLERQVSQADRATEILNPPPLAGKWVSQRCEVRSGPQFLLRSHQFLSNNTFRLTEFHYSDEACSQPLYSLTARGRFSLRGRSWLSPGATDVDCALARVTVTAHTPEAAEEVAAKVNSACPGRVRRRWRPHREYVVLSVPIDSASDNVLPLVTLNSFRRRVYISPNTLGRQPLKLMSTVDVDCLSALHAVFHELQLVRVQRRFPAPPDPQPSPPRPRLELLLGDVHTGREQSGSYRPTSFQAPLLRADQAEGCDVCGAVSRGWERSPPQLLIQPRLPALIAGEWASARCETRPLGMFLTRRLAVAGFSWRAQYRFYSDPACSQPTLTATASGHYRPSAGPPRVQGATDFDFHVEKAILTLLDHGLATSLQRDSDCGSSDGPLQVGIPRDVTPWRGCAPLAAVVPPVQHDLTRVEISPRGTPLLLLGQPNWGLDPLAPQERPSAFQPPLVRCSGDLPSYSQLLAPDYLQTSGSEEMSRTLVIRFVMVVALGLV